MTVNNQGTPERTDDTLLAGATYAVVPDDGDGVFERDQDGPAIITVNDPTGIAVLQNLPPVPYWVVETAAPPGYELAAAAPYRPGGGTNPAQSCFDAGTLTCYADAAGGGMTTVFVVNSPAPATSSDSDYRSPIVIIVAILAAIAIGGAIAWAVRKRQA